MSWFEPVAMRMTWTALAAARLGRFANFSSNGALLDVGTGTGSLAFGMAVRWPGRQIRAIDIAAPYITYARSQTPDLTPVFETGDASNPHRVVVRVYRRGGGSISRKTKPKN